MTGLLLLPVLVSGTSLEFSDFGHFRHLLKAVCLIEAAALGGYLFLGAIYVFLFTLSLHMYHFVLSTSSGKRVCDPFFFYVEVYVVSWYLSTS